MMQGNAWVEKLHGGMLWAEGPVWFRDGDYLLLSDIPNNRDHALRARPYRASGHVSRLAPALQQHQWPYPRPQGRLVSCEHGGRRVSRTELDGTVTVLVDRYNGKRLNSPNDVVVKSDGTIWFTDPPYGILSDLRGLAGRARIRRLPCLLLRPRQRRADASSPTISSSPTASPSRPTRRSSTSPTPAPPTIPDGPRHIRAFDVTDKGKLHEEPRLRHLRRRPVRRLPAATPTAVSGPAPATACIATRRDGDAARQDPGAGGGVATSASAGRSGTGSTSAARPRSTPPMSARSAPSGPDGAS